VENKIASKEYKCNGQIILKYINPFGWACYHFLVSDAELIQGFSESEK
jgi:hypothetical protein